MSGEPGSGSGERRRLAHQYRELLNDIDRANGELVSQADSQLIERMNRADQLFGGGSLCPLVHELDSAFLAQVAGIHLQRVQRFSASMRTFRPLELADRLAAAISGPLTSTPEAGPVPTAAAWASLGLLTAPLLPPVPRLGLLLGTLPRPDAPPPPRRSRTPRATAGPLAAVVTPQQVSEMAPSEAARQVNRLYSELKAQHRKLGGPVGFFEFAYDPEDFGVTVENVFYTAMLVREQRARVQLRGGLPVIEPLAGGRAAGGAPAGAPVQYHQLLLQVDHASWRRIVGEFNIKRPAAPSAAAATTATGRAQQGPRRQPADGSAPSAKRRRDQLSPS